MVTQLRIKCETNASELAAQSDASREAQVEADNEMARLQRLATTIQEAAKNEFEAAMLKWEQQNSQLQSDISKQEANLAQYAVDRAELEGALEDEKSKVSRAELTIAQMSSERDFEMAHKAQLEVAL